MAVTFSLPTVLARLADGQATIEADRGDAGRRRRRDRRALSAAGAAASRRGRRTLSVRHLLSQRRGHPVPRRVRDAGGEGDEITVVAAIAGG